MTASNQAFFLHAFVKPLTYSMHKPGSGDVEYLYYNAVGLLSKLCRRMFSCPYTRMNEISELANFMGKSRQRNALTPIDFLCREPDQFLSDVNQLI